MQNQYTMEPNPNLIMHWAFCGLIPWLIDTSAYLSDNPYRNVWILIIWTIFACFFLYVMYNIVDWEISKIGFILVGSVIWTLPFFFFRQTQKTFFNIHLVVISIITALVAGLSFNPALENNSLQGDLPSEIYFYWVVLGIIALLCVIYQFSSEKTQMIHGEKISIVAAILCIFRSALFGGLWYWFNRGVIESFQWWFGVFGLLDLIVCVALAVTRKSIYLRCFVVLSYVQFGLVPILASPYLYA